jgi:glycosyltransferase involved in cell wall biosynthesis
MKVIIIDDSFTNWYGHNAPYNFSICDELDSRGISSLIFANHKIADITNKMPHKIIPAFRYYASLAAGNFKLLPIQKINHIIGIVIANYNHFVDLQSNVLSHVEDGDIILVAMSSSATAFAHALFLSRLEKLGKIVSAIIIQHNRPSNQSFWIECRLFNNLTKSSKVIFAAQNIFLSELCQVLSSYNHYTLPLPYIKELLYQPCLEDKKIKFVYLGVAEEGKGIDLLPETILALKDLFISGKIEFVIQCNARDENLKMQQVVLSLKELSETFPHIRIVEGGLSPEKYISELLNSDVILNPHKSNSYEYARSGVFSEALSAGIPLIVASGTLMEKELIELQTGLIFDDCSSASLAQTIRRGLEQIDVLRAKSRLAQEKWNATHNSKTYVDMLLNI